MIFSTEPKLPLSEQNQVGVLILNLGTPEAPTPQAVRPYLREFLSDQRVIEMPKIMWQPILRGIILPFRAKKSAHGYQQIWQKEGLPLALYTVKQCEGLKQRLPENIHVAYAMTYGKPSVADTLNELKNKGVGKLVVIPLFPQYASSSTGAALDKVWQQLLHYRNQMSIRSVSRYFNHPGYIKVIADSIQQHRQQHGSGEKLLFSFHNIPQNHNDHGDPYSLECHETARLVAQKLNLSQDDYIVSFQSKFGRSEWMEPSTQTLFKELPSKHNVTKLDVICPGFVSDCIETLEEIAGEGKEDYLASGGKQFQYIPCLNDSPAWLDVLADIIKENGQGWLS